MTPLLPEQQDAASWARHTAGVDGYARATDLDRFAVLHEAADELLDDLTDRYLVERRESKESLGLDEALVRTVRLIPRMPTAAPLAIHFTGPGLILRLGRWWDESLPACACDICGENPTELVRKLHTQVTALTEGGLWERVRRGMSGSWFETRLIGTGVKSDREGPLAAAAAREARRSGFAEPVQWAPWQLRA